MQSDHPAFDTHADQKEPSYSTFRHWVDRFIPANFHDLPGLARRLLLEGKPAGRMAIVYSIMGLIMIPFDSVLQIAERKYYDHIGQSQLPQLFVCGAPRSGTTVVVQTLIKHLPVFYFNNLTSLFPRSPITANKLFGRMLPDNQQELPLESFYGRTTRLSCPNDALYIWDRWVGLDRKKIPTAFAPATQVELARFFSAIEAYSGKPLVAKNNNLNTYAHLVAPVLPHAYFICLDRDPLYLAQSLFLARKFINGDEHLPYGIQGPVSKKDDPMEDICQQALFHQALNKRQQERIGADRFIILPYEDFCSRPAYWVAKVAEEILGQPLDRAKLEAQLPPLTVANKRKVDAATFQALAKTLDRLTTP